MPTSTACVSFWSMRLYVWLLVVLSACGCCVASPKAKLDPGLLRWDPPARRGRVLTAAETGAALATGVVATVTAGGLSSLSCGRSRSSVGIPLREGSALRPCAACPSATSSESLVRVASTPVGVDTLGVRRSRAPVFVPRRKGSCALAKASVSGACRRRIALDALRRDVFARSTWHSRKGKARLLHSLGGVVSTAGLLPLSPPSLLTVAAALKAGGYRSASSYLCLAKRLHCEAGHAWTEGLRLALSDATRSVKRGIGAASTAVAFGLDKLVALPSRVAPAAVGGPICPVEVGVCMTLWMLRGLEAASILGEQASVAANGTSATLDLGPTKTDTVGGGASRTLLCSCMAPASGVSSVCPVHALVKVLAERNAVGLGPKHPLFPQGNGSATTASGVRRSFSTLLGRRVGEHSFRREGAQFYTRHGVSESVVMFLGRWGGSTVRRYIGEALAQGAAVAARSALVRGPGSASCSSGVSCPPASLGGSRGWPSLDGSARAVVEQMVDSVVAERMAAVERAALQASDAHGAVQRATRGATDKPFVHVVKVGRLDVPVDMWRTRCGWFFGKASHVRMPIGRADCKRCVAGL